MSIEPVKPVSSPGQQGMTLIELIIFIVVVGAALAGVLTILNVTVRGSGDPMTRKQMLSISEALMEEVQMKVFTYCDPSDANAASAATAVLGGAGCATALELNGPEASETRTSATTPFNNVNDYYVASTGYLLPSPIADITGLTFAPSGYSVKVDVVPEALNGITSAACASATDCTAMNVLRIAVTVSYGSDSLILEGYRTRFAPNNLP